MLAVTALTIASTIELALFARRDEIEIMRLVGATHTFIRIPCMIDGMVQGLLSGIVSLLGLWGVYRFLEGARLKSEILSTLLPQLSFVSFFSVFLLIATGILVGVLGSYFAARKFAKF